MKSRVRTAVIGVGNMGKNHVRVYNEISTLSGIADTDGHLASGIAETYGVPYYEDYREMLSKEKPEAVSVVVPTFLHKEVTEECLTRRIPTLVEKPIASGVQDAMEMQDYSLTYNTYLLVGHIERFNPAVRQLKKIINQGKIGRILSLLAIRVGISPPRIPHADVVLDLGIHDVDTCNFLLDEYPSDTRVTRQKLFKHTDADNGSLFLTYRSCNAIIVTNWITPVKMRKLYATGTEGFIELDYLTQTLTYYSKIIDTKTDGNFYEFLSLLETPKKELFTSKKEPLKEELMYFLSNKDKGANQKELTASIKALEIVMTP